MRPDKTTILIPCCNSNRLSSIFQYGLPVARVFNATLTLLFMGDEMAYKTFSNTLENGFINITNKEEIRCIRFYRSTSLPIIEKNSLGEEVIMLIFPELPSGTTQFIKEIRFMLRVRKLRLPYIVLSDAEVLGWQPNHIIIPVGYDRTDKESAIWASYFARFSNGQITVIYAAEKEPWARHNTHSNVQFIKKLFDDLQLKLEIVPATCPSGHIQQAAINLAVKKGNALLAITTTKDYSIEHYFQGPVELHTIKNRERIPVLCINPRKDLYVLCK